jgi:diguanylate cyclase (GGDEF)-like protein/PAS domain S-box-containing protein
VAVDNRSRDVAELLAAVLGVLAKQGERCVGVDAVPGHQDAFRLLDDGSPPEGALQILVLGEALKRHVDRALQLLGRGVDEIGEHPALGRFEDVGRVFRRKQRDHRAARFLNDLLDQLECVLGGKAKTDQCDIGMFPCRHRCHGRHVDLASDHLVSKAGDDPSEHLESIAALVRDQDAQGLDVVRGYRCGPLRKYYFGKGITLWGECPRLSSPDLRLVDCGVDGKRTAAAVEGEAREIERRYRTLVEQLPLVIYVDALDEASSNIFTSDQIEPLLGYTVEEWRDDPDLFIRTLHPDDRDRVLAAHARTHRTHEPLSLEYRLIARDGSVVWVRDDGCVVLGDDGQPLYLQGYVLDITPERELQEQLRRQALFDPLTGLANRAFFHEQLEHAVSSRRENGLTTAVVFVDLDEFKQINDQYGHSVGDEVLEILGNRLQSVIRSGDSVARLGGDEFAVLLTSVEEPAEAAVVAERLLEQITAPIDVAARHFSLTASVGIALGGSGAELLKQADAAMYRAKANGDADYAFYDDELDQAALNRFKRIAELREAIAEKQFTLAYQPVVNLEPFEVVGLEALLRWQHPTLGEIPPLDFIPLAEESGLIVQIGRSVLIEACLYASRLRAQLGRDVEMAVNVSARQLQHPEFVDHVDSALERADLPPHLLTLELTESVLVASGERAEQQLGVLKDRGVKLALDDFGTGYASLAYLQRLPVDIVKIDRSFTAKIDSGAADLALLEGIVGLGKALGLQLVAEGIERDAQQGIVQDLGCHGAQGFHFGRPAPAAAATQALTADAANVT